PLGIGDHAPRIDTLFFELLADEPAHMLVSDPRDDSRAQAESRAAGRDVRRRAADIFGKGGHVFQPTAGLLAVEVDRRTPDRDEIEHFGAGSGHLLLRAGKITPPARLTEE